MNNNNNEKNVDLSSKDGLSDFFSDMDDDDETIDGDYDEIDQMIDEVMALLENYGNLSGGLVTFSTIYSYLQAVNFPALSKSDCFEIISRLRTNQVIFDEIVYDDVPDFYLYVFKDIGIASNGKKVIHSFAITPSLTLAELKNRCGLDEEELNQIIDKFQKLNIICIENGKYCINAIAGKQ